MSCRTRDRSSLRRWNAETAGRKTRGDGIYVKLGFRNAELGIADCATSRPGPTSMYVVCWIQSICSPRSILQHPHDTIMLPIATQTLVNASTGVHKQALPRKPRVYSLEPLHSRALALAREKFDLVLPNEPGFEGWRTEAEGLMARNAEVSASDTRVLKSNKLRYISKQGVGVDNFDLDELKKCDIPLMNTPGVNVSSGYFPVRDELICQTTAVAELALGLILDVARRVSTIDAMIRDGKKVTKLDGWSGQVSRCNRLTGVVPS